MHKVRVIGSGMLAFAALLFAISIAPVFAEYPEIRPVADPYSTEVAPSPCKKPLYPGWYGPTFPAYCADQAEPAKQVASVTAPEQPVREPMSDSEGVSPVVGETFSAVSSCAPGANLKAWRGNENLQYAFPSAKKAGIYPCLSVSTHLGDDGSYVKFERTPEPRKKLAPGTYPAYGTLGTVIIHPKKE